MLKENSIIDKRRSVKLFIMQNYTDNANGNVPLKALRQPSQKSLAKNSNTLFFLSNLYLHFLRRCCENIFKIVYIVSEKIGKKISQFSILLLASTRSLFTISLKSKVLFQCCSEIMWPTIYSSMAWFPFV